MKKTFLVRAILLVLLLTSSSVFAANYYWRVTPINNLYTDIGNWETAPGNAVSPATAPSVNDDVFFPSTLNTVRNISLNGGFCRNFNFSASASFTFAGNFTINGSLTANGNASFNIVGASSYTGTTGNTLTFSGSGIHTIDMGTDAQRLTGGGAIYFTSNTTGGNYSLINHNWNTDNTVRFNTQNFSSNGFRVDVRFMTVEGTTVRNINFANSTINVNGTISTYSDNLFAFDLRSTAATYNMLNTRIVSNSTGIFQMMVDVAINIGSLTLNNGNTTVLRTFLGGMNLSMDSLIINNTALYLGSVSLAGTGTAIQTINAGVIRFVKPGLIENYANTTLGGVHTIMEAPFCQGQSVIQSVQTNSLKLNTTVAFSTTSIAYRGIEFGGSGINSSISYNMGLNTGAVTWSGATSSTTFYWVGSNGNWSDPTKWSIIGSGGTPQLATGCVPTYNDDVIFDANSFTGNQTVNISSEGAYCRNITFSDPANEGLLQSTALSFPLNINGSANFTGARGIGNNVYIRFIGSNSHTVTSGTAFTYNARQIVMLGTGTYTLTDNFMANITTNGSMFYHLSGTWNTAGNDMTILKFISKSHPSIVTNQRNLDISNSVITQHGGLQFGDPFINVSYLNSFTASGSHIIQTDNAANFFVNATLTSSSPYNLASVVFNDVSFSLPSGTTTLQATLPVDVSLSYNNVHFASNANMVKNLSHNPFIVDTFWLSSGRLYQFTAGRTFTITGAIEHVNTGCGDLVRINSLTAGTRVDLHKATAPFNVNTAIVKDINASGTTMNIIGGQDAGNNLNVTVTPATGRDMYWVNGTGNWSNGHGHWSIGISGGDPAITNPLGCIPRLIDNVFFDVNSFSIANQTVTIDIDAECKNMLWDTNAGSDNPRLAGVSPRVLNVWGTLEFATGMTAPYTGEINMMGGSLTTNAQSIRTNTISLNSQLNMNGGGRYDQLDNINFNSGISLNSGRFYTNEHTITATHLYLDVRTPNVADISNSRIVLNNGRAIPNTSVFYTYYAYHSGSGNWNATGSYIQSNNREVTMNSSVPVIYDTIVMNTSVIHTLSSPTAQNVTASRIEWRTAATNTLGNFTTGTLIYQQSSTNNLQAGRTVLVTDTLIAYGSPCVPIVIRSATAGTPTNLNAAQCNFNIPFAVLTDIVAQTCTPLQNSVVGTNGGNSLNWTFTTLNPLSPMGDDTLVACQVLPFVQGTKGFGDIPATYSWSTGETSPQIDIYESGTYSVTVTYAPGCSASGTRVVEIIDTIAPTRITSLPIFKINTCFEEAEQYTSLVASSLIPFYMDDCYGTDSLSIITTDTTIIQDDCGWQIIYTYNVVDQHGNTLSGETLTFHGEDTQVPIFTNVNGDFVQDDIPQVFQPADVDLIDELPILPVFPPAIIPTLWFEPAIISEMMGVDTDSIAFYSGNSNHTTMMRVATFPFELTDTLCPNTSYNFHSKINFRLEDSFAGTSVENLYSVIALYRNDGVGNYSFVATSPITEFLASDNIGQQDSLILTADLIPGQYNLVVLSESTKDTVHFHTTYTIEDFYFIADLSDCSLDTLNLSCYSDIPSTVPVASDNCSNTTLTYSEVFSDQVCTNTRVVTRNWIAVDACGNQNTYREIYRLNDSIAPIFSVTTLPADTTVNCDAVPTVATATLTATDNCGTASDIVFSATETSTQGAVGTCEASNYVITRTYTATDLCGNVQSYIQTINIQDTILPVFDVATLPADTTVNCDAIPVAVTAGLTATDNCSLATDITFAVTETSTQGTTGTCGASNYVITRAYTATDLCGNVQSYIQTINIQDTILPVFDVATLLADTTVSCDAIPVAVTAGLTATDNCSLATNITFAVTETSTQGATGTCGASNYVITRMYTATDLCGNVQSYIQTINVQDTILPVFDVATLPADTTVNCDAVPVAVTAGLTATDNCSSATDITFAVTETSTQGATGTCEASNYIITRTYTAIDLCGNIQSYAQTINVQDTIAPVFVEILPTDTTVNCNAVPTAITLTATDNCTASVTVNFTENTTAGACPNAYTLTRTWTVSDECNNTTTHVQIINVQDTIAPVFAGVLPSDTTVNCNAVPTATTLTATDNCTASVTVNFTENTTAGACPNAYTLTRTWTVSDECNNSAAHVQIINVQDTIAPIFAGVLPGDTTVNCDAVPTATTLTATDNCTASVTINFTENTTTGTCPNTYTLTRTWTVSDECNNSTTHVQIINVQDTIAPVFVETLPTDTTVNCDAVPTAVVLTATDNCTTSVSVTYDEIITSTGSCTNEYTLTRTWTVSDECGNSSSHVQTINIQDTIAPVLSDCPSDITIYSTVNSCGVIANWIAPTATDNCSSSVAVTSLHTSGSTFLPGTTTVTYTATDECGNVATCSFDVTIIDSIAPSVVVTNISEVCEGIASTWTETITDNCAVTSITRTHDSGDVFPVGTTTVTITGTDASGNTSTYSFDVIVHPLPTVSVNSSYEVCVGNNLSLSINNPNSAYNYFWVLDGSTLGTGSVFTISSTQTTDAGQYIAVATTDFGCLVQDYTNVIVSICGVTISETFSPNGDGQNEVFHVEGLDAYPGSKVWIHNRWGLEVYQSDNYQNDWDGHSISKLNISGDELPEGTYFYILQLGGEEGQLNAGDIYKGYVYIKR